jgi:hypothetical protein
MIGRVTAELASPAASRVHSRLGLELSRGEGETGGQVLVRQRVRGDGDRSIESALTWSRRLPLEDRRVWLWRERGLEFLEGSGLELDVPRALDTTDLLALDVTATTGVGVGIVAELAPMLRVYSGLAVENQRFRTDANAIAFDSPTELLTDVRGGVGGIEARLRGRGTRVAWRASYRYQTTFDADAAFDALWAPVPEHSVRLTVDVDVARGLGVRAVARVKGSRAWPEYADIEEDSLGRHAAEIDPSLGVDLSIRQRLLRDRLDVGLAFFHLFDEETEHAIGAVSELRFVAQAQLRLGAPPPIPSR